MADTATPEVDTRQFTPNQIAIAVAKRIARVGDFDENWSRAIAERGIELAEDGTFTITTEGGQTFHLTVTEATTGEDRHGRPLGGSRARDGRLLAAAQGIDLTAGATDNRTRAYWYESADVARARLHDWASHSSDCLCRGASDPDGGAR